MNSEKAIIKSTGEEHRIVKAWELFSFELDIELSRKFRETITITPDQEKYCLYYETDNGQTIGDAITPDQEKYGRYYEIDNGQKLHEDELIVGTQNIRQFKLDKLNGI